MSSPLLSALAKLDDSVRLLERHLDCLDAGLDVSREQFILSVSDARQNADTVREQLFSRRPDIDWADRQSLENLIRDLEAAEAGRKELSLTKLLELAEELNAGTITHRLKSRVTALEGARGLAVQELLTEAANDEPKDLPGPHASAWMRWAFGLQDNAHAEELASLERDFPALVVFVCDMEESYWQPRESSQDVPRRVVVAEIPSVPQKYTERPSAPLAESAPAFAARYGHLSAAKAGQVEIAPPTKGVSVAATHVPEIAAPEPPLPIATASPSKPAQLSPPAAAAPAQPVNGSALHDPSPSAAAPARRADWQPAELKPIIFPPFSLDDEDTVEDERRGFRLNRPVLITIGAIAAIVLVMVVISAVSGNVMAKRSSSAPPVTASDSAKGTLAAALAAPVSDIELVGQIEQRLKVVAGASIYVTVQHGTAILEGQVPSEEALSQAEELTLQSSQIKVVRDRLQVAKSGAVGSTNRPAKSNPTSSQ